MSTGVQWAHGEGITGRGVTVAVVVPGTGSSLSVPPSADGHQRLLQRVELPPSPPRRARRARAGAAEAGLPRLLRVMLSGRLDRRGRHRGVAPNADLVLVTVRGGRARDLALGIDWIVANQQRYGVRVLYLPPMAPSERDAGRLGRAIRRAWAAGLLVVAASGDGGPGTALLSPAALPAEVLAVGSAASGEAGWQISAGSAGGALESGIVKPEIIAPEHWANGRPDHAAGTATAAAVVAGVASLLLEAAPWLTPDQLKLRLMITATPTAHTGWDGLGGGLRQGAGVVNAEAALRGLTLGEAEARRPPRGLLWSDLAGRGLLWSDLAGHGLLRPEVGNRSSRWPDRSGRGLLWSDAGYGATGGLSGPIVALPWPPRSGRGLTWSD